MLYRILLIALSLVSVPVFSLDLALVSKQSSFYSGTVIELKFVDANGLPEKSWIGIYKKGEVSTTEHTTYQYLQGKVSGVLAFSVPKEAGEYEFRAYGPGYEGKEYTRLAFTVKSVAQKDVKLLVNKESFKPVEAMEVQLSLGYSPADKSWVGIFPREAKHNVVDGYLTYQYTNGNTENQFTFKAPEKPGDYELRFFDDSYGNEIASLPFSVSNFSNAGLLLKADKADYDPQSNITVDFVANKDFPEDAWIGVFKGDIDKATQSADDYLSFAYLKKRERGKVLLKAPSVKGDYHLKMFSTYAGSVVAKAAFSVNKSMDSEYIQEAIDKHGKVDLYGIYFDIDQSEIKAESTASLQALIHFLEKNSRLAVAINGHTDSTGDEKHNLSLSKKRALAVKAYLIEGGIQGDRLKAYGYGESRPVKGNHTEADRALNRRVEITKISH